MARVLQRIDAAVIDGRAQAPRFVQKQLTQLYDTLQKGQSSIRDAIIRDTGCSTAEVETEMYLTFKAVKQEYEAINFQKAIEQEYSLAHSKDNASRRIPVGCIYIIPSQHTRFYSIVQPIAAAFAAGNCVIVEVSCLQLYYSMSLTECARSIKRYQSLNLCSRNFLQQVWTKILLP